MSINRACKLCFIGTMTMLLALACGGKKETKKILPTTKPQIPATVYIGDTTKLEIVDLTNKSIVKDLGEEYIKFIAKYVKVTGKAEYYTVDGWVLNKEAVAEQYGKTPPTTPLKYIVVNIFSDNNETLTLFANSAKYGDIIKKMPFNQRVVAIGKLSEMASKNTFSVVIDE